MTTLEVCGPGCEMVVFVVNGKRYMAWRRDLIRSFREYTTNSTFIYLDGGVTHEVDMPFDDVLCLLDFGTCPPRRSEQKPPPVPAQPPPGPSPQPPAWDDGLEERA